MKKVLFLLVVIGALFAADSYSQNRRANNPPKFFISALEGFDGPAPPDTGIGHIDGIHRYYDYSPQDSELSLNGEWRKIWEYPTYHPDDPAIAGGGPSSHFLDVIMLEPSILKWAQQQSRYLKFETERHTQGPDTSEYLGFYDVPRDGNPSLVGNNVFDAGATSPAYLIGSSRSGDASVNAVQLVAGTDAAGIFCDSFCNENFFGGSARIWSKLEREDSQRVRLRFKVRLDGTFDTSLHTPLFEVLIKQDVHLSSGSPAILDTTVYADENFIHNGSDYDLIMLPFFAKMTDENTQTATSITLRWLGDVSMTMDYMEVFTGNRRPLLIDNGEYANFDNYEELTQADDSIMKMLIDTLINRYEGKAQYIMTQEEFGFSQMLIFKRMAKMLRDRSNKTMEFITLIHDSTDIEFYGKGLPNRAQYLIEGVQKGWLDSSLYADPVIFFGGSYLASWESAMPKRAALTDSTEYANWEIAHAPTGLKGDGSYGLQYPYNRATYPYEHAKVTDAFFSGIRVSQRTALRNTTTKQRFIVAVQDGVGVGIGEVKDPITHEVLYRKVIYGAGLRAPTAAEFKEMTHLAISTGGIGIVLYTLADGSDSSANYNGGMMMADGRHDTNMFTFRVKDSLHAPVYVGERELWIGWKERFDTAKVLLPRIRRYGDAVVNSIFVGEWKATELLESPDTAKLPFNFSSLVVQDDDGVQDAIVADTSLRHPTIANKTFVHFSMWIDTVGGATDTMIYITNMRSDDSYGDTEVPQTFDSRYITFTLKRPHIMVDVADTNGGQLDNGVIWTPFVGIADGDSLKVHLLPGDGVLIRMLDTVQGAMLPMKVAINYPKNGTDFNDHGRIAMDRPLPGILDKSIQSKWTIPSTSKPFRIGIPDTSTVKFWQDSLLYHSVDTSRPTERWRQQNWTEGTSPFPTTTFGFKKQMGPLAPGITKRFPQLSTDSIPHKVVITTDMEGFGRASGSTVRLFDPWFVDATTRESRNTIHDTIERPAPFEPHIFGVPDDGSDSSHYGGIFLRQNPNHFDTIPIYSLNAMNAIQSQWPYASYDTSPYYTDWAFLGWITNDSTLSIDTKPWPTTLDSYDNPYVYNTNKSTEVVFVKDSAVYTARYKAHMATFDDTSGYDFNGQRKLYYLYRDTLGRRWYRTVYGSNGRVYTTIGYRWGPANSDIIWNNEELISPWDFTQYSWYSQPALTVHNSSKDSTAHYVYVADAYGDQYVRLAKQGDSTLPTSSMTIASNSDGSLGTVTPMPVIAGAEGTQGAIDVIAWVVDDGIVVKGVGGLGYGHEEWTDGHHSNPPLHFGNSTATHPTIWMDSCRVCDYDSSVHHVVLAWQQDTAMLTVARPFHVGPGGISTPVTDIFAVEFDVKYSKFAPGVIFENIHNPVDISYFVDHYSYDNRNPCISGARYNFDTFLVRIAYENMRDSTGPVQGIEVAQLREHKNWKRTVNINTWNTITDRFSKPSIEVTRYKDVSGTPIPVPNYYSLTYEGLNGTGVYHMAMDSDQIRVIPYHLFLNIQRPQLAVSRASVDSEVYRLCLSRGLMPLWLIPGYTTLYKKGYPSDGPPSVGTIPLDAVPNPTTGSTELSFTLPEQGSVTLSVMSILGEEVTKIYDNTILQPGTHSCKWNSKGLPPGVYIATIRYGNFQGSTRVIVTR